MTTIAQKNNWGWRKEKYKLLLGSYIINEKLQYL